ncbi:MAG: protease complex subunit PrcB family protein [Limisphaerales bacterium]
MRTIAQGNFSGVQTAMQLVVTNSSQWEKLWREHSAQRIPAEPAPEINFEKETVFFVAAGRKRSGGHQIEIAKINPREGETEVIVKSRSPKPGGIQIQALTAPFHVVAVPKIQGNVKFKIEGASPQSR